ALFLKIASMASGTSLAHLPMTAANELATSPSPVPTQSLSSEIHAQIADTSTADQMLGRKVRVMRPGALRPIWQGEHFPERHRLTDHSQVILALFLAHG